MATLGSSRTFPLLSLTVKSFKLFVRGSNMVPIWRKAGACGYACLATDERRKEVQLASAQRLIVRRAPTIVSNNTEPRLQIVTKVAQVGVPQ